MKKKILWILLIILILVLGYISYIVIDNNINNDKVINKGIELNIEKMREYQDKKSNEYIEYDTKGLKITINDKTMNICYSLEDTCEEVGYTINDDIVDIEEGNIKKFNGIFSIIKNGKQYIFIKDINNVGKLEYYFNIQ